MVTPLFRRLLGPAMDRLGPALAQVHDANGSLTLAGTANVWRSGNPLARLLCDVMRLPRAGESVPVAIRFERNGDQERWQRRFAGRRYASRFAARGDLLVERMGLVTNIFRPSVRAGALHLELVGFRFLGLSVPSALRPRCHAIEAEEEGAFTFDVPVSLPGLGPVIRYRGRLALQGDGNDSPIILFDALCILCSANAQFVLRHDRRRRFRLASIQSEAGRALCRRHGVDPDDPDTIIVVTGDTALRDSDAVLAIYAGLEHFQIER